MNGLVLIKKLKTARLNKGFSQETLAEETNISLRTIQRIEKGSVNPRPCTIKILSEKLNINLSESQSETNSTLIDFSSIKKMNIAIMISLFIPFANILIILLVLSTKKTSYKILNRLKGKVMSFQVLWTVFTFLAFFLSIVIHNMVSDNSGDAIFTSLITYSICIAVNIIIISQNTLKLDEGDQKILRSIPNFFSS